MATTKPPLPPRWFAEQIRELTEELNGLITLARHQGHEVIVGTHYKAGVHGGEFYGAPRVLGTRVELRDDPPAPRFFAPAD